MKRGWRVTAEANCVPFLSALLRAGVKLRVTLPLQADWVPVPVLNCVQDCVCVCFCVIRDEGQEAHLFLISQKALLSGPGGAGVPVWKCTGGRGRVSGHTHTVCVGHAGLGCDVCVL